jgi:small subunit ribosomal protein S21
MVWTGVGGKRYIDEFPNQNSNNTLFQCNGVFVVKLNVREKESIQEAVRRFRKLVERSGIKKEMRRREYYEKPSETRRRARLRAERRTRPRKII